MNATLSNDVDTILYPQYYADPADIALRSALFDALEELKRFEEIEIIQKEWEPRAWLIAKGRKPINRCGFHYANFSDDYKEWAWDRTFSHWVPGVYWTVNNKNVDPPPIIILGKLGQYRTPEDLYDDWNKLTNEWKNWLWNWNPPI